MKYLINLRNRVILWQFGIVQLRLKISVWRIRLEHESRIWREDQEEGWVKKKRNEKKKEVLSKEKASKDSTRAKLRYSCSECRQLSKANVILYEEWKIRNEINLFVVILHSKIWKKKIIGYKNWRLYPLTIQWPMLEILPLDHSIRKFYFSNCISNVGNRMQFQGLIYKCETKVDLAYLCKINIYILVFLNHK